MSGWLDALLGRIRSGGVALTLGYGLDFKGGLRAALNPSTKFVDVTLAEQGVGVANLAPEAAGVAPVFVLRIPMTAGTPGTADDVTGSAAPAACRVLDKWADVTTAIGGSSLRVRDAAGGVGDTLSGTISSATQGEGIRASSLFAGQTTLAAGEIPYVRRSDRGVAGTVYLLCERV
jgi:hypothetical protein